MITTKLAIFASGNGTNAENLMQHFSNNKKIKVSLVVVNNPKANVVLRAKKFNVPSLVIKNNDLKNNPLSILNILNQYRINYIILAGFLRKIPQEIILAFPKNIINIHPALLPKFGGKGMYGKKVHQSVKLANEKQTGITIHLVNKNYDEGEVIFQTRTAIGKKDTVEEIEQKVRDLEMEHFPKIVEQYISQ